MEVKLMQMENTSIGRSPQYREVYIDWAQASITNWDVRLLLGLLSEIEPGKHGVVQETHVIMTYEFAKALNETLSTAVLGYESKGSLAEMAKAGEALELKVDPKTK